MPGHDRVRRILAIAEEIEAIRAMQQVGDATLCGLQVDLGELSSILAEVTERLDAIAADIRASEEARATEGVIAG